MQIQVQVRVNDGGVQFRALCAESLDDESICGGELTFGNRPDVACENGHFGWNGSDWKFLKGFEV